MGNRDIALAVMSNGIAVAGLLLVFIGFLLGKADQIDLARKRNRVRFVAISGLIPFLASLACALISIWAIQGAAWSDHHLFTALKLEIALTAGYAIMAVVAIELLP